MGASDKSDRASRPTAQAPAGLGDAATIPSALRDLTESGDFYSATPAAWARYRAAVNAGDWGEVLRHEQGEYGDFRYAP